MGNVKQGAFPAPAAKKPVKVSKPKTIKAEEPVEVVEDVVESVTEEAE